jgi:DHA2 family multidrug resistance protein
MIGLHVDAGDWLVSERVGKLAHALFPNSAGTQEAQGIAAQMLGGQVRLQAYALAYSDGYIAIALVAALIVILIAFMKPMKIHFDATPPTPTK